MSASPPLQPASYASASVPEVRLIYDTAPIGLAFLSTDCRYLMINQHLTEICGISVGDHIGRSVRETLPQIANQVEQIVQAILRNGEPTTGIEVNGQRPDGSNKDRVWITYWHPVKDRTGQIVGINVAAEEITQRKRAEADLAANREELRKANKMLAERVEEQAHEHYRIWNLSQDLFVVSDGSGKILNVNPAWQSTLGWLPEDLVGKNGEWLVHPADRELSLTELSQLVAGLKTQHFENRCLCKDGSYRWLSWFAVPDRGLIYATGRDVTNVKRAEEQLHALRREVADASRQAAVGAMTASITHEVRQPLTAIVTNANSALRWLNRPDPNLARAQSSLDQIIKASHHLNEVVDSVRGIFAGHSAERGPVDVYRLVTEVLALAGSELATHLIVVQNNVREGLPNVMGARVQLQQVILNLVINAIEAMQAVSGRERCLSLSSTLDEEANLTITIADTGIGMDPTHVDRIFDPFFTTKRHGMGLGLSICRTIIEGHGGKLLLSPRTPFGTMCQFTLPTIAPVDN
jgi:PAS domain S-box-containing protein